MEIKKVSEESYEMLKPYLDKMITMVDELKDLYLVKHKGMQILICEDGTLTPFVVNDRENYTSYFIGQDGNALNITKFSDEDYLYEICDEDVKEITRTSYENGNRSKLVYLPAIENQPRDVLEYVQYLESEVAALSYRYDVSNRHDASGAVVYSQYHFPDNLVLKVLKEGKLRTYNKKYYYSLGLVDIDKYYRPLFRIGEKMFGTSKLIYDADMLIDEICKRGFTKDIPRDLKSLISDDHQMYNELRLVSSEFKKELKKVNK